MSANERCDTRRHVLLAVHSSAPRLCRISPVFESTGERRARPSDRRHRHPTHTHTQTTRVLSPLRRHRSMRVCVPMGCAGWVCFFSSVLPLSFSVPLPLLCLFSVAPRSSSHQPNNNDQHTTNTHNTTKDNNTHTTMREREWKKYAQERGAEHILSAMP